MKAHCLIRILFDDVFVWRCNEKRETRTSCDNWNERWETQQGKKMLDGLTKWLKVGRVTEALEATWDRDAWKVMIVYAKEHGT